MTKHEADVIGGLNMTDQISNEAYKQIMIAAQDENEVGEVLDKIRAEINGLPSYVTKFNGGVFALHIDKEKVLQIIDKYRAESEDRE
jgi:hypothetical protein